MKHPVLSKAQLARTLQPKPTKTSASPQMVDSQHRSPIGSSKRHVSDPENHLNIPSSSKSSQPRRQSLGSAVDTSEAEKYGSARGGRGGRVTTAAKSWANDIESDQVAAKGQPVHSKHTTSASNQKSAVSPEGAPVHNSKEARKGGTSLHNSKRRTVMKEAVPTTPIAQAGGKRYGKATAALTFVNMTGGKGPTFAKATQVHESSHISAKSKPYEGSAHLRDLIAKFSQQQT